MSPPPQFVHVSLKPASPFLLSGVTNACKVLVDVTSTPALSDNGADRPPLNLCILLDRSGSMQEQNKLVFAKDALVQLLKTIGERDIVHLVVYDDSAQVVFQNGNRACKDVLINAVQGISIGGCTNIEAGFTKAAETVSLYKKTGYTNRIFFFSDGLVNGGKTGALLLNLISRIHEEHSVRIDSFGIGKDFDPFIMRGAAEKGGSQFYYLDRSETIPGYVLSALDSASKHFGSNAILTVRGANGAVVKKAYFTKGDLVSGFQLGDLYYEDSRRILLDVEMPGTGPSPLSSVFVTAELQYLTVGAVSTPTTVGCQLGFTFTNDAQLVRQVDPVVAAQIALQEAAVMDAQVEALIAENDLAKAIALQEAQLVLLRKFAADPLVKATLVMAEGTLEKLRTGDKDDLKQDCNQKSFMTNNSSTRYAGACSSNSSRHY